MKTNFFFFEILAACSVAITKNQVADNFAKIAFEVHIQAIDTEKHSGKSNDNVFFVWTIFY